MPRIRQNAREYKANDFSKEIKAHLSKCGKRQTDLAFKLGISQQAFSKKLSKCGFTYRELLIVFRELDFTDDQIIDAMRY